MTQLNHPRTLAWQFADSEHILACPRVSYEKVRHIVENAGKGKWILQLQTEAKFDCCKDPANLDIEAWFSKESEQEKGTPDVYKIYCRVCEGIHRQDPDARGYCHAKFCVGGNHPLAKEFTPQERPELFDRRPFWEIR